jgi:hypothetical protein
MLLLFWRKKAAPPVVSGEATPTMTRKGLAQPRDIAGPDRAMMLKGPRITRTV